MKSQGTSEQASQSGHSERSDKEARDDSFHTMGYRVSPFRDSGGNDHGRNPGTLVEKIHLICGDMDNWYLSLAVYLLEDFPANTTNPYYAGSFEYGRPLKGHGWQPTTDFTLIKRMADEISANAPRGDDPQTWHYPVVRFELQLQTFGRSSSPMFMQV